MSRDQLFLNKWDRKSDFKFDKNTAEVFDDMLARSVPLYSEIQFMIVDLISYFLVEGTNIYDFGCSTGTTIKLIKDRICFRYNIIGFDSSKDMLNSAEKKLKKHKNCVLQLCDFEKGDFELYNMSVAIMLLTLQFIRPIERDKLIKKIYDGLRKDGCFILVEKILCESPILNRSFIDLYYRFKGRNNYSKMEISRKREALENVLVPYKISENVNLLNRNGFSTIEVFFQWFNFVGIIAIK